MPDAYRKTNIRQISQHAQRNCGYAARGQLDKPCAISLKRKAILLAKVQDEGGHGFISPAAETLGMSRNEMINDLHSGKAKYSSIFNYPTLTWADIGALDGWWMVPPLWTRWCSTRTSYGTLCPCHGAYLQRRKFSPAPGFWKFIGFIKRQRCTKAMCQDAINRWWWPALMMFGPKDSESTNSDQSMKWKIKRKTNDELRQNFVDMIAEQVKVLGMKLPGW